MALAMLGVGGPGCDAGPGEFDLGATEPPAGVCIADPNEHHVQPLACAREVEGGSTCPAGTACRSNRVPEQPVCLENLGIDPNAAQTADDLAEGSACLLTDPGQVDPRLLRLGFGSDGMSIDLDLSGTVPTVSWARPAGADEVVCALFGCEPQLVYELKEPGVGSPRLEARISNAASCIIDRFGSTASFESWGLEVGPSLGEREFGGCEPVATSRRWINGLWLACWATDESEVVATSNLRTFSLAEIEQIAALPVDCVESETGADAEDGRVCIRSEPPGLGVCLDQQCAPPCVVDSDCAELPAPAPTRFTDGMSSDDMPRWYCSCCPECGYVGACEYGRPE